MEKQMKIIEPYNIPLKIKSSFKCLVMALLKTLAISCLIGIAYGISIFMFKSNIIVIPILGILVISYVYNSNYREENINLFVRLIVGLISALQVIVAFLVCEIAYSEIPLYPRNISMIISEYGRYTLENPIRQAIPIFLLVICFMYGLFQDYAFRFQKLFKLPFMKKWGNYYYKKEGHMFSIYMIDPRDYDDNDKNRLVAYVTEGCYIEKQKKRVKAFYLPKADLDEAEISIESNGITVIDGKEFYKIDLGSSGEWQQYASPCALVMDNKQNVEIIQLEL